MNMRVVLYFLGRISMALGLALGLTAALSVVCGDAGFAALAGAALVS